jgi:hypothetical protein
VRVIRSASKKVRCAKIIVSAISVCSLFFISLIKKENPTQIITHNTIPPIIIAKNESNHANHDDHVNGCLIASKIMRKIATAVPSLNKLSPSSIKRNLLGSHISFAIDSIATGSVDEIITANNSMT